MKIKKLAVELIIIMFFATITGLLFNNFSANGISLIYSQPVIYDLNNIPVERAYQIYQQGNAQFIDARSSQEYEYIRIENSINLPSFLSRDQIADRLKNYDRNQLLVVYCTSRNCNYSDKIAEICRILKYSNVQIFKGGIEEWDKKGYPLFKPGN